MEKRIGVTDLINRIVQILKKDLYWVKISIQDIELIKPVKQIGRASCRERV